jgi:hypothetical protein
MVLRRNKVKKPKILWRGVFNYRCGLDTEYAKATTKAQAKVFMMRRIAAKHEVSYATVFYMFDGTKDNYFIEEDKGK